MVLYSYVREFKESNKTNGKITVIAAAENLVAGAVIGTNNLGVRNLAPRDLPNGYIPIDCLGVIDGHKLVAPVSYRQPLQWRLTDIVLTNRLQTELGQGT